jgi:hypothetical protein
VHRSDFLSDILLQHHAVETRRWLTALITKLKAEGFTTLAVMDPEMHPSQKVRAVLDLFDAEINIFRKETDRGPAAYLKIRKMSNQKYLDDELPLKKEDAGQTFNPTDEFSVMERICVLSTLQIPVFWKRSSNTRTSIPRKRFKL